MKKNSGKSMAAMLAGWMVMGVLAMGATCDDDIVVDPNGTTISEAITGLDTGMGSGSNSNIYYSSSDHFSTGNATLSLMNGISVQDSMDSYLHDLNMYQD